MKPLEQIDLYLETLLKIAQGEYKNKDKMIAYFERAIQIEERKYANSLI